MTEKNKLVKINLRQISQKELPNRKDSHLQLKKNNTSKTNFLLDADSNDSRKKSIDSNNLSLLSFRENEKEVLIMPVKDQIKYCERAKVGVSEDALIVSKKIEDQINQIKIKINLLKNKDYNSKGVLLNVINIGGETLRKIKSENFHSKTTEEQHKIRQESVLSKLRDEFINNLHKAPSNINSTLQKFYSVESELVKKLNYFDNTKEFYENTIYFLDTHKANEFCINKIKNKENKSSNLNTINLYDKSLSKKNLLFSNDYYSKKIEAEVNSTPMSYEYLKSSSSNEFRNREINKIITETNQIIINDFQESLREQENQNQIDHQHYPYEKFPQSVLQNRKSKVILYKIKEEKENLNDKTENKAKPIYIPPINVTSTMNKIKGPKKSVLFTENDLKGLENIKSKKSFFVPNEIDKQKDANSKSPLKTRLKSISSFGDFMSSESTKNNTKFDFKFKFDTQKDLDKKRLKLNSYNYNFQSPNHKENVILSEFKTNINSVISGRFSSAYADNQVDMFIKNRAMKELKNKEEKLNLNKLEYLSQIDNLAKEKQKQEHLKSLKVLLKQEYDKNVSVTTKVNNIQHAIEEFSNDIDILNLKQHQENLKYDLETSYLKKDNKELKKHKTVKHICLTEIQENTYRLQAEMKRNRIERQERIKIYQREIYVNSYLKDSLKIDNANIERKINSIEEKIKTVEKDLLLHYHNILIEGKDTRDQGLTWVIQSIWNIGSDVIISYLPKFLDEKLVNYIFIYSHKSIELQKVKQLQAEIKEKVRHYNGIKIRHKNKKLAFKKKQVIFYLDNRC